MAKTPDLHLKVTVDTSKFAEAVTAFAETLAGFTARVGRLAAILETSQVRQAMARGERPCGIDTHSGSGVAAGMPCRHCGAAL